MHSLSIASTCLAQCATPSRGQPAGQRRRAAAPACSSATESPVTSTAIDTQLEKQEWQSNVRNLQGRRKHRLWQPVLQDPPPLLGDVCVVLLSPKRPISVGTVARSLSCFECEDLRIVQPRCDHMARSGRNGSKGAQHLMWQAQQHDSLQAALADVDLTVACTRWVAGRPNACRSVAELLATPEFAQLLAVPSTAGMQHRSSSSSSGGGSGSGSGGGTGDSGGLTAAAPAPALQQGQAQQGQQQGQQHHGQQQQQQQQVQEQGVPAPQRRRLALVFGREVEGLLPEEVDACDYTLSIPIGRLQESMSLSHAVSVVLSRLFELRQQASGFELPQGVGDLAEGYQDCGVER